MNQVAEDAKSQVSSAWGVHPVGAALAAWIESIEERLGMRDIEALMTVDTPVHVEAPVETPAEEPAEVPTEAPAEVEKPKPPEESPPPHEESPPPSSQAPF